MPRFYHGICNKYITPHFTNSFIFPMSMECSPEMPGAFASRLFDAERMSIAHHARVRESWRRGRDSNPREAKAPTRFPVAPVRPLRHLSSTKIAVVESHEYRGINGLAWTYSSLECHYRRHSVCLSTKCWHTPRPFGSPISEPKARRQLSGN